MNYLYRIILEVVKKMNGLKCENENQNNNDQYDQCFNHPHLAEERMLSVRNVDFTS